MAWREEGDSSNFALPATENAIMFSNTADSICCLVNPH